MYVFQLIQYSLKETTLIKNINIKIFYFKPKCITFFNFCLYLNFMNYFVLIQTLFFYINLFCIYIYIIF